MQLWPIDILGETFKLIPEEAPKIAQVCRRFRFIVDQEWFWALRLQRRFQITEVPTNTTAKAYYLLYFSVLTTFKRPLRHGQQPLIESAQPIGNGYAAKMVYRLEDGRTLELWRSVLCVKDRLQGVQKRWELVRAAYYLEKLNGDFWRASSSHSTYLIDVKKGECHLVVANEAALFVRDIFLFALTADKLYVCDIRDMTPLFNRTILVNGAQQIYHFAYGEVAMVTDQDELILINRDIRVFRMPAYFRPRDRLDENRIIVERDGNTHFFDLVSCQLEPRPLGRFAFKIPDRIAFTQNETLTLYSFPNFEERLSYPLSSREEIICLTLLYVLYKSKEGVAFRVLNLKNREEHLIESSRMTYIGSEGFFLVFAKLTHMTLDILSYNPMTRELIQRQPITSYHFHAATRITDRMEGFVGNYLVVNYASYEIKVMAILQGMNGEYKRVSLNYKY